MREDLGEVPDCENCKNPVLWPCNYEAWRIYGYIANKFTYDFHALPLIFEVLKPEMTRGEALKLLDKLILIHGIITRHDEDEKT